jgi:hypothetical protein
MALTKGPVGGNRTGFRLASGVWEGYDRHEVIHHPSAPQVQYIDEQARKKGVG